MMMIMKTLCLILTAAFAAPASAAMVYTDRAAFEALAPGLPVEDFEAANLTQGPGGNTQQGFTPPLSSTSDDVAWNPGDVIDGFVLSAIQVGPQTMNVAGNGRFGSITKSITPSALGARLVFSLTPGVEAFGLDFKQLLSYTGNWTIEPFGANGSLGVSTSAANGSFYGIISSEPIFNVIMDAPANAGGFIDNLTFGNPIPEPHSALLVLSAGMFSWRRRRTM